MEQRELDKKQLQQNLADLRQTVEWLRQTLEWERQTLEWERERYLEINARLRADVLAAKGLLTARGIFEYILQIVFEELQLKGRFNASVTCNHIANNFIGIAKVQNIFSIQYLLTSQNISFRST